MKKEKVICTGTESCSRKRVCSHARPHEERNICEEGIIEDFELCRGSYCTKYKGVISGNRQRVN